MSTASSKISHARQNQRYNKLVKAWQEGGLPAVKKRIRAGRDYTEQLLAAASDGHAELAKKLLDAVDDGGCAALMDAIDSKRSKTVQQLIEAGQMCQVQTSMAEHHCIKLLLLAVAEVRQPWRL
jgi:hypothetical protein